ncbi:MAG: T9SS type A sorting domain-containing protein, partial [Bacteroidales bacterium]|nr:T9SS type A sorting domain-containing protein [Bacteroidales bacterium]
RSEITSIHIYNLIGEQVEQLKPGKSIGLHKTEWNLEELPAGVYFCVLKTNEGKQTKKMIKL